MLAKTKSVDMILGAGTELGVPDAYTLANLEGNVNTEKVDAPLNSTESAMNMCGLPGAKNLPTLAAGKGLNTLDPLKASISKVNVTGISPSDLSKNIPLAVNPPSFMERVGSAIGSGVSALASLPLGQMSQVTGMMSSVMGTKNPLPSVAVFGSKTNYIQPGLMSQAAGLTTMVGSFTGMMKNYSSGRNNMLDAGAAVGLLGGIMSQASRLNVTGAIGQSTNGVPIGIINSATRNAAGSVVGSGSLGAFNEMSVVSSPGVIRSAYPNAVQDFSRSYTPQYGNPYASPYRDYNMVNTTYNAVDPNWNSQQRGTNPNDVFAAVANLSAIAGGNTDFRRMMQIGAGTNILSAMSSGKPVNPNDLLNAASGYLPMPAVQSIGSIMNRFPQGYAADPNQRQSINERDVTVVPPSDGSVGYGTITPEMREELNRLSPSKSSSAARDAGGMQGSDVTNYGDKPESTYEKPTGNPAQPASNPKDIAKTQTVLYGDEPEFDGADEEAAAAAAKPQVTGVTVY